MINKESIISIFDGKPTLLQWLKKVEEALNNASAVSFNVNKRGNATLTLSIVFEDGSEIESNEFVLEQGESVQSAEVVNGVLYFTLTNGDVLNAGNIFNGNITITGNLTATGALNGASAAITGNVNAGGDVEATGALKGASAAITGNVNAGGDVEATGALKGASAVVSGSVTAGSVATNGGIVAGGGIAGQGVAAAQQVTTPKLTTFGDEIAAEKPIIEVMRGYSFTQGSKAGMTLTPIYVGACKNGNKLTIVYFVSFTRTATIQDAFASLGNITIPNSVLSKLYPYSVGDSTSAIDYRQVSFYKKSNAAQVSIKTYIEKVGSGVVYTCTGLNGLEENEEYVARFENTFLLSNNLA